MKNWVVVWGLGKRFAVCNFSSSSRSCSRRGFWRAVICYSVPRPDCRSASETPAVLTPVQTGFDYIKRDVMIPMRDG